MSETAGLASFPQNLVRWRQRRGMTASALARAAQVSKSTISELERGNGNPSFDTIWSLAKALNVSLGALFASPVARDDTEHRILANAPVLTRDADHFTVQLMASWQSTGEVELCVVSLAPHARRSSAGNAPGVMERVVCLEGPVEVGPEGRLTSLWPGDMLAFRADQPHVYQAGEHAVRMVVVQQYPVMP